MCYSSSRAWSKISLLREVMQSCRSPDHCPLSSNPAAYNNYLQLPAVYSAWSQTRNCPDPGSHCLGQSWDSRAPPLGPPPCPRSRTHTWGVVRMRVDTPRVTAGSCPGRSRRCCRSTRCCPRNIYTPEARPDNPADTLEEEWMASALKWIIKDSCEEWYWNMVSMLIINEGIDSGRGIIIECNFVWDYDCDWCCSRGWLGDIFQNSGHDLVHGEKRGGDLRKKWLKIMQPQITGRRTLDSDANPIPNIEILLQKHSELLLPFLIFHLALQIVTYPDFISNNFSLIATINQDTIFSQVQNVNIQRPYISDHLVE